MSNEFYLRTGVVRCEGIEIPVDVEVPFKALQEREMEAEPGMETATEVLAN